MRKTSLFFATAAILTTLAAVAWARSGQVKAPPPKKAHIKFEEHALPNGLRVILDEDHAAPTFSLAIIFDVGSRNERPGRTGFAHLFEHLMFEGSANVGKGEYYYYVFNNGGDMNGTTDKDRTAYYETLPANQLDLALFLESDRMRSLTINQANLDNQRNAVQEERRIGEDNAPYGTTNEELDELAYDNVSYKHSVIGSMDDLNAASLADVTAFFRTYYAPNNAALALVGDFKSADALAKITKAFGDIPRQPAPPPVDMTQSQQTAERRKTITDSFAQLPMLNLAFRAPAANTPDWYALDVLGDVLASGRSSRLYRELVDQKQMVTNVAAGPEWTRGPSLFHVRCVIRPGHQVGDIETAIEADLADVSSNGITSDELLQAIMRDRTGQVTQFIGTLGRAIDLAQDEVFFHNPNLVNTEIDQYGKVTLADVQRAAKTYLTQPNRTVLVTNPKPAAAGAAEERP